MNTTETDSILRLKIDNTDIFLEEIGENQGKITISNTYGYNYSNYWGSMGGTLKDFICQMNADYFSDKLLGSTSMWTFDQKNTFKEVRRHISEEIGLPWYKHQEFQKEMRKVLNDFQQECETDTSFVDNFFSSFIDRLDFWLIKDRWERQNIEASFRGISEQWYFIQQKPSDKFLWLKDLHSKLKKALGNGK